MIVKPLHDSADLTTHELKDRQPTQNELELNQLSRETGPPPLYSPPQHASSASTSSSSTLPQLTFKSKPTNHLYLSDDSVKGEYVIDPCMSIPASLLPPLSPEESEAGKKNLCLHAKNGAVNVVVWLLSAPNPQLPDSKAPAKRTILDLGSEHGSVTVRLQTIQGAAPFLLTISANNGAVYVTLPRSFTGLLLLTTKHGSISLADTISENSTYLSQVDKTRRYFVGDLSLVDDNGWTGDEVRVDAKHGRIKVNYVEEDVNPNGPTKGGVLSRLFKW